MRYHQPPPAPVDPYAAGPCDRVPGVVLQGSGRPTARRPRQTRSPPPSGPAAASRRAAGPFAPQPALQFHGAQRVDPFDHGMTGAPREEQRPAEPSPIRGEVGAAAAGARAALEYAHTVSVAAQSGESPGFMSSLMNMHVGESPTEVARRRKRKQWSRRSTSRCEPRRLAPRLHAERAAEDVAVGHL